MTSTALPATGLQLQSRITRDGRLEVTLVDEALPVPGDDQVLVRIEAAPLNPSDLGLLFGAADMTTAETSGPADRPVLTARVPERAMPSMAGRVDQSMPVGNEGAGVVVAAGASADAQALLGRRVAALGGGGMYAQYRCVAASQCLALPDGASAVDGASSFVNPLTALGMVETMRRQGHKALVHTAAASNLGQMLVRLCRADGIELVNIVRKPEQVELLKAAGARWVCNSEAPDFVETLTDALVATGATIAFDAIGGGPLAGRILQAMEAALVRDAKTYSRYGSPTHKQVYLYGGLDTRPTEIVRSFGMHWSMGGWLVFSFLGTIEPDAVKALKRRVADELTTTFASRYQQEVSLVQMLQPDTIAAYNQRSTGAKFLVRPDA